MDPHARVALLLLSDTYLSMSNENVYDILCIGGGSGGLPTARRAAQHGAKACVVESGQAGAIGGTCVNVGCVPKKFMWNAANLCETLNHHAEAYCFEMKGKPTLNFPALKAKRDKYIERLHGIYNRNLGREDVSLVLGRAVLNGKTADGKYNRVNVTMTADGSVQELLATRVVVCVGGVPSMPTYEGAEHMISSDGFFELEELPERACVVGAGYIAVELAGVMHSLGVKTTLITRNTYAMRGMDHFIHEALYEGMVKQGITVANNCHVTGVTKCANGKFKISPEENTNPKRGHSEGKGVEVFKDFAALADTEFDVVLGAIGRKPNTWDLGLAESGVEVDKHGFVVVDEYQNTTAENVYALGDCSSLVALTPVAIAAGRFLAERLYNGQTEAKLDYELVPTVVFSHPAMGTCGLTEAEAVAKHGAESVTLYRSQFASMYYAPFEQDAKPKVQMKLVCVGEEQLVVGIHLRGRGIEEMVQGFALALKLGATKKQWDSIVAIHPTASEEMVTMKIPRKPYVLEN
jgi:glutathione reductase (NADPH)